MLSIASHISIVILEYMTITSLSTILWQSFFRQFNTTKAFHLNFVNLRILSPRLLDFDEALSLVSISVPFLMDQGIEAEVSRITRDFIGSLKAKSEIPSSSIDYIRHDAKRSNNSTLVSSILYLPILIVGCCDQVTPLLYFFFERSLESSHILQ